MMSQILSLFTHACHLVDVTQSHALCRIHRVVCFCLPRRNQPVSSQEKADLKDVRDVMQGVGSDSGLGDVPVSFRKVVALACERRKGVGLFFFSGERYIILGDTVT